MEALMSEGDKQRSRLLRLKKPGTLIPIIGLVLVLVIMVGYFYGFNSLGNAHADGIQKLPNVKTKLTQKSQIGSAVDPATPVTISIGLRMHDLAGLQQYVKDVSSTKNKLPRSLTTAQIIQDYSPYPAEQQAVIDYMHQYGFTTSATFDHRLVVSFTGTIGQAEQAFNVSENYYTAKNGQTFYASSTDPSVPSSIAPYIVTVEGLDNAAHFTHTPIAPVKSGATSPQAISNATATCKANSQNGAYPTYYTPSQISNAYGLNTLRNTYKGNGQSIGLIEFADYDPARVATYTACYGGAAVPTTRIAADGKGAAINDGTSEAELDMELVLSTAPQLGSLNVYEAQNSAQGNLAMWGKVISDAVPVVSTSWGQCEAHMTLSEAQQENALFTIAAAQGQSILASSGDDGSSDCLGYNDSSLQVDDPASQPYVTAVGGTSLTLDSYGNYKSETTWNDTLAPSYQQRIASGGGISSLWAMPTYQQGIVNTLSSGAPCAAATGYCREVPDISFNADPNTGYPIYTADCSTTGTCQNQGWHTYGGTSTSAPMYASLVALANQYSLSKGYYNIGFLNPLLYSMNANYYANFHDITTGSNNLVNTIPYNAAAGYDMATGLGSPFGTSHFTSLADLADSQTGQRQTPAATKWYFSEGRVGNGYDEFISILNPSTSQTANIQITYLFPNGRAPITRMHTVAPSSRGTVALMSPSELNYPDTGTASTSVSAIVESLPNSNNVAVPIVAERPMYFNIPNSVNSGSDVIGATDATQTSFYFPIADTRQTTSQTYNTFITILNPSSTATANVTATSYANGQTIATQTLAIPPLQRGTLVPQGHQQMSMKITSDIGIVAERPLYFKDTIATAGGAVSGAATTVGATSLGKDWLFAEGNTGKNYQENLVLANFTANPTTAQVNLEYTNGQVQTVPVVVNAYSQVYFDVNAYRAQFPQGTNDVAAAVHDDDGAIVVERMSYFNVADSAGGPARNISGALDAIGEASIAGHTAYSFAEGYTAGYDTEFLTLLNQTANKVHVAVTVYADNTVVQKTLELSAHTRSTMSISAIVEPLAKAYPVSGAHNVSMSVQGLDGTVVAERVFYFLPDSTKHGGTSMFGFTG